MLIKLLSKVASKLQPKRLRFDQFNIQKVQNIQSDSYSPSWVHSRLAVDTPPLYSFDNSDPDLWKNVSKEKLLELVGPCELPANPGLGGS